MAQPEVLPVGVIDGGASLSGGLVQTIVLALARHASTPRTVVLQATGLGGLEDLLGSEGTLGINRTIVTVSSEEQLCTKLKTPRCVLVFGEEKAQILRRLDPYLEPGDAVIVATAGHSADESASREIEPESRQQATEGVHVLYCGFPGTLRRMMSGGTSIVVSCSEMAWAGGGAAVDVLKQLAASDGRTACVTRVGTGAVAHLVQQVHDSTELSILQLINEACNLLTVALRLSKGEMADVLESWGKSHELSLDGYLLEVAREVLRSSPPPGDPAIVPQALRRAGGGAAVQTHNIVLTASVADRPVEFREEMSRILLGPGSVESALDRSSFVDLLGRAMAASLVIIYAQAFDVLCDKSDDTAAVAIASVAKAWSLRPDTLFSMRGTRLAASFAARTDLKAVLADPQCQRCVEDQQLAWRQIIAQGALIGVPLPTICGSLHYYDAIRSVHMVPATMLASQLEQLGYSSASIE